MDNKKTIVKVDDNDTKTKTHTIWVYKTINVDQSGQYFLLAKVKPQRFDAFMPQNYSKFTQA